jgi:hypothetical protein
MLLAHNSHSVEYHDVWNIPNVTARVSVVKLKLSPLMQQLQ